METNYYINQELENEIRYLRERNAELVSIIEEQKKEIEKLKQASNARKKPGRKRQNSEWQDMYVQIKGCLESGMKGTEIMKKLSISRATVSRYKKIYKEEKRKGENPENA